MQIPVCPQIHKGLSGQGDVDTKIFIPELKHSYKLSLSDDGGAYDGSVDDNAGDCNLFN